MAIKYKVLVDGEKSEIEMTKIKQIINNTFDEVHRFDSIDRIPLKSLLVSSVISTKNPRFRESTINLRISKFLCQKK